MFRSGNQDPVMVVFNNVRTLDQVAGKVSVYLEGDSADFATYLADTSLFSKYGFSKETFTSMFIPNTYEFFWNISPEQFAERMNSEYRSYGSSVILNACRAISAIFDEISISPSCDCVSEFEA